MGAGLLVADAGLAGQAEGMVELGPARAGPPRTGLPRGCWRLGLETPVGDATDNGQRLPVKPGGLQGAGPARQDVAEVRQGLGFQRLR